MKFVKKYDDAGKALVVIDTEGLEIPEDLKSLLVFSISTYKALGAMMGGTGSGDILLSCQAQLNNWRVDQLSQ